jgi:hypothetical protein
MRIAVGVGQAIEEEVRSKDVDPMPLAGARGDREPVGALARKQGDVGQGPCS